MSGWWPSLSAMSATALTKAIAGDVVGVPAHAVADQFAVDAGAAPLGVLPRLQDDDARPLSHDKTVARGVKGARGLLRFVVAGGDGLHRAKAGHAKLGDRRLRAAGDHRIRLAALDDAHGVTDGIAAGS